MTDAEAIRQLRHLIVRAHAREGVAHIDADFRYMLQTVAEIARDGLDPVIELRIRRFTRLYGDAVS
jgi:predicted SprT family Zn-dependent metalloprotease